MNNYQNLIESKVVTAQFSGFDVDPATLHASLFDHQRDIVTWCLKGGNRAVFASFGLGKTRIAIETCRQIILRESGKALFIAPLGVRQEFTRNDGPAMGVNIQYCKIWQRLKHVKPHSLSQIMSAFVLATLTQIISRFAAWMRQAPYAPQDRKHLMYL
jgi:hypothetical protein